PPCGANAQAGFLQANRGRKPDMTITSRFELTIQFCSNQDGACSRTANVPAQRQPNEQLEANHTADRISGQAEYIGRSPFFRAAALSEPERFLRLHGHFMEYFLHTQGAQL